MGNEISFKKTISLQKRNFTQLANMNNEILFEKKNLTTKMKLYTTGEFK